MGFSTPMMARAGGELFLRPARPRGGSKSHSGSSRAGTATRKGREREREGDELSERRLQLEWSAFLRRPRGGSSDSGIFDCVETTILGVGGERWATVLVEDERTGDDLREVFDGDLMRRRLKYAGRLPRSPLRRAEETLEGELESEKSSSSVAEDEGTLRGQPRWRRPETSTD